MSGQRLNCQPSAAIAEKNAAEAHVVRNMKQSCANHDCDKGYRERPERRRMFGPAAPILEKPAAFRLFWQSGYGCTCALPGGIIRGPAFRMWKKLIIRS